MTCCSYLSATGVSSIPLRKACLFLKVSIKVIVLLASLFANSLVVCKVCLIETGTLTIPTLLCLNHPYITVSLLGQVTLSFNCYNVHFCDLHTIHSIVLKKSHNFKYV